MVCFSFLLLRLFMLRLCIEVSLGTTTHYKAVGAGSEKDPAPTV